MAKRRQQALGNRQETTSDKASLRLRRKKEVIRDKRKAEKEKRKAKSKKLKVKKKPNAKLEIKIQNSPAGKAEKRIKHKKKAQKRSDVEFIKKQVTDKFKKKAEGKFILAPRRWPNGLLRGGSS